MTIFSTAFLRDAGERAVKSFAQGFAVTGGLLSAAGQAVAQVDVIGFPWVAAASAGGGMALASILTSIISAPRDGTLSPASAIKPDSDEIGRHSKPE